MLARLLLALLVLLAVPATAAPACHQAAAMAGMAHHDPAPARHMPVDMCIGCIAPVAVHAPVLRERIMPPAPTPVARLLVTLAGTRIPPATPPPRRG